jgi:hypothetical protein
MQRKDRNEAEEKDNKTALPLVFVHQSTGAFRALPSGQLGYSTTRHISVDAFCKPRRYAILSMELAVMRGAGTRDG